VVFFKVIQVDLPTVDDHQLSLLIFPGEDYLLGFIDAANKFESDLVLKVDGEVSEKEDALLDDPDIGLQHKLLL